MLNIKIRGAILFLQRAKFWYRKIAQNRFCVFNKIEKLHQAETWRMQSIHLQHPTFPSLLGDGWNVSTSIIAFFRFDTLLSFSLFLFLSLLSVNRYHVNGGKKYLEQNKTKHDSEQLTSTWRNFFIKNQKVILFSFNTGFRASWHLIRA